MARDLRSPFLDEETLAAEADPALGTQAANVVQRSPFASALEAGDMPAYVEHVMAEPARTRPDEVALRPHLLVVDEHDTAVTEGEYAFHQGAVSERGRLAQAGLAYFGNVDPSRPFRFEVRDRVCTIRVGAFLNPDDASIEYGGTSFDWTLVRDDRNPDRDFWPYYRREMDFAAQLEAYDVAQGRHLDWFAQHEHITRRPIQIARPFRAQPGKVRICARPAQLRVGPFVRYTDHERALIWLETVTPCVVHVRFRWAGGATASSRYASTVRVGGRHFGVVEVDKLDEGRFHDYTVELAPLPATGAIPVDQQALAAAFPTLTRGVAASMKKQLAAASLNQTEWLSFRALRRRYDKRLLFATGSCRWYPGDKKNGKDHGPDMLDGLGQWLRTTAKESWPQFLFFGGDQIYADEIGDDHGAMIVSGRFAARIPGPADPAASARNKLVDGAWAGRFAHRYRAYKDPPVTRVEAIRLAPGYLQKNDSGGPDLALFENSVALVDVAMDAEVRVKVTHLAGKDRYTYRYTSGAGYTASDAPGVPGWRQVAPSFELGQAHYPLVPLGILMEA